MKLEIRKVGDDTVIVVPAEVASELGWDPGEVCEGEVHGDVPRVVRTETKHASAMRIARQMMEEYRETFEKLAKS